jgi:hypothetical protein
MVSVHCDCARESPNGAARSLQALHGADAQFLAPAAIADVRKRSMNGRRHLQVGSPPLWRIPETLQTMNLTYPLLTWTRPLTASERNADIRSDLPSRALRRFRTGGPYVPPKPHDREGHLPTGWYPVLPGTVPQCRICTLPNRNGLCAGCSKLRRVLGTPLSTLEVLSVATKGDVIEQFIWDWKGYIADGGYGWGPLPRWNFGWDSCAETLAAALSAYSEAHAHRLMADEPLVTSIPSRGPVIAACFALATERG